MAKTAKEKTQAAKQLDAAKAALKHAKEKLAKTDNQPNKAAVETAMRTVRTLSETVNRERFLSVGAMRMTKAMDALRNLSKVANARSYTFTEADVAKIENDLVTETKSVVSLFKTSLAPGGKKSVEKTSYSFE